MLSSLYKAYGDVYKFKNYEKKHYAENVTYKKILLVNEEKNKKNFFNLLILLLLVKFSIGINVE